MRIHWIFWCICNCYDFTIHTDLKCCSICYSLVVIWRGSFKIPNFGELGGSRFAPSESPPTTSQYISIQSFALSAIVWLELQCQTIPPANSTLVWSHDGPRGSKMVPIKMSTIHCYLTSIYTIGLSCTVWPRYTMWQMTEWSEQTAYAIALAAYWTTPSTVILSRKDGLPYAKG